MGLQAVEERRGAPALLGRDVPAHGAALSTVSALRFRSFPMLAAALSFAAGICLAHLWRPAAMLVTATGLLVIAGLVAALRAPRVALPCVLAVWVLLGWACAEMRPPAVTSSALLPYEDGLRRDVRGRVLRVEALPPPNADELRTQDPVHPWEARTEAPDESVSNSAERAWSVDLELAAVEEVTPDVSRMVPESGGLRLTIYGSTSSGEALSAGCGDLLRVPTRLTRPQEYRTPGVWQRGSYLAASGIIATGNAKLADVRKEGTGAATWACRLTQWRSWAASRFAGFAQWERHLQLPTAVRWSAADAGEVDAMLLGDRAQLQKSLRVQFERTGTFHLFVVAGFHVSVIAGGLYWLLLKVRCPRGLAVPIALALATGYALITGFGQPVQRALLMTAAFFLARLLSRERSVLNAVGIAALAMLVAQPAALFDAGLQMTVLVALTIGGIAAPFLERTLAPYGRACRRIDSLRVDRSSPPRIAEFRSSLRAIGLAMARVWGRPLRLLPAFLMRLLLFAAELGVLSLVTECAMALPMAVYFHRVTPLALPANLLLVPLLPLLLGGSMLTFLCALLCRPLALLPGMVTALLLHAAAAVVRGVGGLPEADWRSPGPPAAVIAAALALFVLSVVLVRSRPRRAGWLGVTILPMILLLVVARYAAVLHPGMLEVTAVDVGQGDAIFVAGPQGATMLIDAGGVVGSEATARARLAGFDTGEEVVSPYLWSRGIRQLDVLVLTHAHMDHIGGMMAVLRNFRPRELWVSVDADSLTLRELLRAAVANGVVIRHMRGGDVVSWNGAVIQVLSPSRSYVGQEVPVNDDSLVMRVDFGSASALLEGDAERSSEHRMAQDGQLRPVTLLKAGHHGSSTSTTDELVQLTQPRAAVISCGRGNRFGHPRMPVLERLQAAHVLTSRTDDMGAAQYLLHRDGSFETHILSAGDAPER